VTGSRCLNCGAWCDGDVCDGWCESAMYAEREREDAERMSALVADVREQSVGAELTDSEIEEALREADAVTVVAAVAAVREYLREREADRQTRPDISVRFGL